ncbi:MAG: hypothetical protein WAW90_03435 [Minisyncoccia bacterium]
MSNHILSPFALIVALGIFFAYVNPMWGGSIAATQAAIAADDQALASAQRFIAQQNKLASARDAIDPTSRAALNAFLPSSADNVGLTLDLDALAARSGLSITSMDVITSDAGATGSSGKGALPASGLNPVASADLSISAVGTFASLQSFLTGVEMSSRLLDVRDLSVRGSDTGLYSYQMTVRLYWLR